MYDNNNNTSAVAHKHLIRTYALTPTYVCFFVFVLLSLLLVYEQGKGVEKDVKLAGAKFKEAADLGSVQAKVRLEQEKIRTQ